MSWGCVICSAGTFHFQIKFREREMAESLSKVGWECDLSPHVAVMWLTQLEMSVDVCTLSFCSFSAEQNVDVFISWSKITIRQRSRRQYDKQIKDKKINMKVLLLFTLLIFSHYCSESQRSKELVTDGPSSSLETLLRSGNIARHQNGRRRRFMRRQMVVRWCSSRMKAKKIDNEMEWKKIIGATVFVLVVVHFLYFCTILFAMKERRRRML